MEQFELHLGDMQIIGNGAPPPAKLIKALAVIADRLHPAFDGQIPRDKSKESCVLCALTVRDFLRTIGFASRVEPVLFLAGAQRNGVALHALGMGARKGGKAAGGYWNGHLVTLAAHWLIDTTLYQVQRPAWAQLPGMMAIPLHETGRRYNDMPVLASIASNGTDADDGYLFDAVWMLDRKNRGWKYGPDSRNRLLREPVIGELVERFGGWNE
jgi:hypothetical protein